MPVETCTLNGKSGHRWGKTGKCYTGPDSMSKAKRQGRAVESSKNNYDQKDGIVILSDIPQVFSDTESFSQAFPVIYFDGAYQTFSHWSGDFTLDMRILDDFVKGFNDKVAGRDLYVNYDHGGLFGGDTKAAGWFKELSVQKNGDRTQLVAKIEWTPEAKQKIENKEYRYFSSEIVVDPYEYRRSDTGESFKNVFIGGALTNNPFFRQTQVALSDLEEKGEITMDKEELLLQLKDNFQVDVVELDTKLATMATKLEESIIQRDAAVKALDDFKADIEKNNIERLLSDLVIEGKSSQELNDKLYRQMFTSLGYEKASEAATIMPKLVKDAPDGTGADGVELSQSQKDHVAIKELAAAENIDFASAASKFYQNRMKKKGE